MGKSETGTLPPLIYGPLEGVLELFLDNLELNQKCILKPEDYNLIVKVLWWGESKPSFIRPKRTRFLRSDKNETVVNDQGGNSVKYEVKTKLNLFKSYLKKCEVLELVVLDSVKNETIGSSFLKDLINLIFSNRLCRNLIINDFGDPVGEMTYHFKFSEVVNKKNLGKCEKENLDAFDKWNKTDLKLNLSELSSNREDTAVRSKDDYPIAEISSSRGCKFSNDQVTSVDEVQSGRISNMHYNSPAVLSKSVTDPSMVLKMQEYLESSMNMKRTGTDKLHRDEDCFLDNLPATVQSVDTSQVITYDERPVACSSKVKKSKTGDLVKNSAKIPKYPSKVNTKKPGKISPEKKILKNKPVVSTRNVKSAKKTLEGGVKKLESVPNRTFKSLVKPGTQFKTLSKVSNEISKINKVLLKPSGDSHSDLEKFPVKEQLEPKIPDEAKDPSRLSSPCDSDGKISNVNPKMNKSCKNQSKVNVDNKLFFDLNDPVEKVYYETFFSQGMAGEFEIVEMLNCPENKYSLERENYLQESTFRSETKKSMDAKVSEVAEENLLNSESDVLSKISEEKDYFTLKNDSDYSSEEKLNFEEDSENTIPKSEPSNCHRCKYFKKLSELDKIIDALKRFEMKLKREANSPENGFDVKHPKSLFLRNDDGVCHSRCSLVENELRSLSKEKNSGGGQIILEVANNESDFSKEDSDFIEFTHYLSKR